MAEAELFDTLIVGAGAAGLVAAAELSKQRGTVCVLEARDRLGGRMFTRREPGVALPIELGAEFIHGRSPVTARLAREIEFRNRRLRRASAGLCATASPSPRTICSQQMKRGLTSIRRPRKDLPFSEFLDHVANRKLSPAARQLARALVEGFDAADATRVSTWATLDEWSGNSSADSPTFRPLGGYASLIDGLLCALEPDSVQIQLSTIVHTIRWQRGRVTIEATRHGQPCSVQAKRAIITLPVGVLQLAAHARGSSALLARSAQAASTGRPRAGTGDQGRDAFSQAVLGRDRRRSLS